MKLTTHRLANGGSAATPRPTPRPAQGAVFVALLLFFSFTPGAWTQYSGTALTGPTVGASLRNAAAATQTQAAAVRKTAYDWGRRVNSGGYRAEYFQQDYANLQWQFQSLRMQFNQMGSIALQLGRPRADNAVAELDAGLNVIAELFVFLEQQYMAGPLDRSTIVRTCDVFQEAMREWERELKKSSTRMGFVW